METEKVAEKEKKVTENIKLKPDCELAKAIEWLEEAYHDLNCGHGKTVYVQCKQEYHKARAHLLEVIQRQLNLAGDASTYLETNNYDPIQAVQAAWEEDGYGVLQRRIANEIMEVVSDG